MAIAVPTPPPGEPTSLHESIDWMGYSHQELYDMVHNGVDLSGATDVAAAWAKLSDSLGTISQALGKALDASTDGWQGQAADQARTSLSALVDWARTSGDSAVRVSGCVSRQADALQTARTSMPAPVAAPPRGVVEPADTTAPSASSFVKPPMTTPGPIGQFSAEYESHQQAARVMQQYQVASAQVEATIPQFAAPTDKVFAPHQPVTGPTPPPGTPPVRLPASAPVVGGRPVTASGGTGRAGGIEQDTGSPGAAAGSSAVDSPGPESSGAAAESVAAQGGRTPVGGTAMGGAGARRDADREHKRKYLQNSDGIFALDQRPAPPVIGEGHRG